jgi:hypothetical protein
MGFLGGLFGKRGLEKHTERATNKRAQAPDRMESILALAKIAQSGEPEERPRAIAALLTRFTFYVDPSITDGEEKDEAYRAICATGETAVEPIRAALRKHESLSWPLKCLEALLSDERIVDEMIAVLGTMSTEYERDPQRKIQLLSTLEQRKHESIAKAVVPFFADVNEPARFHAASAALEQDNAESVLAELAQMYAEETSVRVKSRMLEKMSERGFSLASDPKSAQVPEGWHLDAKGVPRRTAKKKA